MPAPEWDGRWAGGPVWGDGASPRWLGLVSLTSAES